MSTNIFNQEAASLKVFERAFAQAPEALYYLKPYSFANIYKYLTSKALEGPPERERSLTAARFFWQAVRNDPTLLRTRVFFKVLFKIAVTVFLSPHHAQVLLTKVGKLSDVQALYGYIRLELPSG
jgi:hypothetical protein